MTTRMGRRVAGVLILGYFGLYVFDRGLLRLVSSLIVAATGIYLVFVAVTWLSEVIEESRRPYPPLPAYTDQELADLLTANCDRCGRFRSLTSDCCDE